MNFINFELNLDLLSLIPNLMKSPYALLLIFAIFVTWLIICFTKIGKFCIFVLLIIFCLLSFASAYNFFDVEYKEEIKQIQEQFEAKNAEILSKDKYIEEQTTKLNKLNGENAALKIEISNQKQVIERQQNILREQDKALTNKK